MRMKTTKAWLGLERCCGLSVISFYHGMVIVPQNARYHFVVKQDYRHTTAPFQARPTLLIFYPHFSKCLPVLLFHSTNYLSFGESKPTVRNANNFDSYVHYPQYFWRIFLGQSLHNLCALPVALQVNICRAKTYPIHVFYL